MSSLDEYRREVEEAGERVKKEIAEVTEKLENIASDASENIKKEIERARDILGKAGKELAREAEERARCEGESEKNTVTIAAREVDNGKIISREIAVSDFSNVEVDCAFRVQISRSDSYSLNINANEKLFDYINVIKSGNTLRLSHKPLQCHTKPVLEVNISMPTLLKLRQSGATKATVSGFKSLVPVDFNLSGASALDVDMEAGDAKVEIAGASQLNGTLKVHDVDFILSGASRAELHGSGDNAILSAWGASNFDLADFALKNVSIHLKGASQAMVNVSGKLDIELAGASGLSYTGSPRVGETELSGAVILNHR
jgi:hypothetical protein